MSTRRSPRRPASPRAPSSGSSTPRTSSSHACATAAFDTAARLGRAAATSTADLPLATGSRPRSTVMQGTCERIFALMSVLQSSGQPLPTRHTGAGHAHAVSTMADRRSVDAAFVDLIGAERASCGCRRRLRRLPADAHPLERPPDARRPASTPARASSTSSSTAPAHPPAGTALMLVRLIRDYLDALPRDAGVVLLVAPARRHHRLALPAQPQRPDHRRGRGQGRHRLHPPDRRLDARPSRSSRSSPRRRATYLGAQSAAGLGRDLRAGDLPPGRRLLGPGGLAVRRAHADLAQHQRRDPGADGRLHGRWR